MYEVCHPSWPIAHVEADGDGERDGESKEQRRRLAQIQVNIHFLLGHCTCLRSWNFIRNRVLFSVQTVWWFRWLQVRLLVEERDIWVRPVKVGT